MVGVATVANMPLAKLSVWNTVRASKMAVVVIPANATQDIRVIRAKSVVVQRSSKMKPARVMVNATVKRLNVRAMLLLMALIAMPKVAQPTRKGPRAVDMVRAMNTANACVKIDGPHPIVECQPAPTCAVVVVYVQQQQRVNAKVVSKVKIAQNVNVPMRAVVTVLATKKHFNVRVKKVRKHGWETIARINVTVNVPPTANASHPLLQ